ncbi:MAG: M20/M25/M40 family metallo-hydrolase [Candidatus Binatia bacterium]
MQNARLNRFEISRFRTVASRSRIPAIATILIIFCAFYGWTLEIPSLPILNETDSLRIHARFLASSELTGRAVDTPGIKIARDYIAKEFAEYGLAPGGDNGAYFQGFEAATGVSYKPPTQLTVLDEPPLKVETDWIPLGLSASGKAEAEVVFAGYGITAKDHGYDDYAGLDVRDKVVLVLRYEPPPKDEKSPFQKPPRYSLHAALRTKANNAREHGAVGMILVDLDHRRDEHRELISMRSSLWRSGNSIVAAQVKRQTIEKWLAPYGVSLAGLKDKIDSLEKPASMPLPDLKISLAVTLEEIRRRAENVVAVLPGSDATLKHENIVIGAHYDHLGFGHFGTRDSSTEGQIHHGADDNASGTTVLLELARRLSRLDPKPQRTIVFAAFSAEELGLHGSRHYVNHPPFPLASTKAMLNLDMVGRLRDNRLTVFGANSAKEFGALILDAARRIGLEIRESDGIGRSDHMSFYNKKIPVLHFFTGIHADYHRPGDTWEKLNFEGMAKIAGLVLTTTQELAAMREPLNFAGIPARPSVGDGGTQSPFNTYLGSIPDYGGSSNRGVKLAGVSAGSPAALAGLREGDVIVRFAGAEIRNIEDLTAQLRAKKPGDEVVIVVLRGAQSVSLKAVLRARS